MKKIISLVLCLLIIISLATPAFAAHWSGNGYHVKEVMYNGKYYSASITTRYNSSQGAYTAVSCHAPIEFLNRSLTVMYDTINYGYVTDTGSSMRGRFSSTKTEYCSAYVPCSWGMSQVIAYMTIRGSAIFYAHDGNHDLSVVGVNKG